MFAIVDIAGQQFKVEKDNKLFVHRLEGEVGSEVEFDKVLLIDNDGKVRVGEPVLSGALVSARILEHMKGEKVLVFKKKRRKGYQKLNGHRQYFTLVQVEQIVEEGGAKKPVEKKVKAAPKAAASEEAVAEAPAKPKVKKAAPVKEAKEKAPKKAAATASKKPAAKAEPKAAKKSSKK
jgi:large subunit ribosomal protein L21